VLGTADGRLHRLRKKNGKTIATLEIEGLPFSRPLLLGDALIVLTTGGRILAVDVSLGGIRWERHVDTEWATFRPISLGDAVLAGADDDRVYAFRVEDGMALWSQEFGGPVTSLTDAGDILFIGNTRGLIFACDLP
jgi:outer membrane protein assembly factor BamB